MEVLKWLAEFRNPALDVFFSTVTYLGQEVFLLGVMCIFYWCIDKKFAYRIGIPFFIAGMTVNGLKLICRVDRPWIKDPTFRPVESAKAGATGYSFPSGHTHSATVLAASFADRFKRRLWQVIAWVLAGLVMLSRMYLGVHTPQDVLVSFAICLTITLVAQRLMNKAKLNDKKRLKISIAMTAYIVITLIYSGILCSTGYVTETHTQDVFKIGGAALAFAIGWYIEERYIRFKPNACCFWKQILKIVLGAAGVVLFKAGLKPILGESLIGGLARYFLMGAWMIAGFPLIIKKWFSK